MSELNPLLVIVRSVLPGPILPASASLYERNCALLDAFEEIFGLSKITDPLQLKALMSAERVRLVHESIASIFPPDLNFETLIEPNNNALRAYFMARIDPSSILQDVVRYSLYTDQIYILNPFLNPIGISPEYNPVFKPSLYRQYTLKIIAAILILKPWIRSKIVQIVPDPGDFNYPFKIKTWEQAEARFANLSKSQKAELLNDPVTKRRMYEEIERLMRSAPDRLLLRQMKAMFPEKSDDEHNKILRAMRKLNEQDPLALPEATNQLLLTVGGNLEHSLYMAECFSAFPYTSSGAQWKELSLGADKTIQPWSPLTKAFQQLDFTFLDSADVQYASKLREEGRLQLFRNFLRKTWNHSKEIDSWSVETGRSYADELVSEFNSAKSEWGKIGQDVAKWSGGALAGFVGSSSLAVGKMEIALPSAAFFVKSLGELWALTIKAKDFPKNMPASIFMDLENRARKGSSRK